MEPCRNLLKQQLHTLRNFYKKRRSFVVTYTKEMKTAFKREGATYYEYALAKSLHERKLLKNPTMRKYLSQRYKSFKAYKAGILSNTLKCLHLVIYLIEHSIKEFIRYNFPLNVNIAKKNRILYIASLGKRALFFKKKVQATKQNRFISKIEKTKLLKSILLGK